MIEVFKKQAKRKMFSELRKSKGTQKKVAMDNNISTIYIRKIENGELTPGRDLMFKLADYFEKPAEQLFPDFFEMRHSKR